MRLNNTIKYHIFLGDKESYKEESELLLLLLLLTITLTPICSLQDTTLLKVKSKEQD